MSGTQQCARCRKPLSKYTTGRICGPCITAARDAPGSARSVDLPLEFWFAEPVASALAEWDWAAVLQVVHRATDATQSAIATQTGLSQASVSRLMAGRSGGRTIETALKLLDGLGAPRILAGLAPKGLGHITGRSDEPESGATDTEDAVKRRDFATKLVLAGLSIPLWGPIAGAPDDVDVITGLDRPADAVADLFALDARHGGAALVDLADARLRSIESQLRDVTLRPSDEALVHSVIGQVTAAAAWFAYERRDFERADRSLKDGLYAAHCADDTGLRLMILDTMAMVARAKKEPGKAVTIAQGALDSGTGADPQLRALLTMRVAVGHARLKDQESFSLYTGRAWDLLGKDGRAAPDEWFKFFGVEEVHGLEAIGRKYLGHHERSAEILDGITAAMPPRNRAYYRLTQADALARSGQIRDAVEIFHSNLPLLAEMTSARITRMIRTFAAVLRSSSKGDAAETSRIALNLIGEGTRG